MPSPRSAAPTRFTSSCSWAYVNVRCSPRSFSVMRAVREPVPVFTWWSTQLYARFERPPRYQRNVGGSQSSTRSHLRNQGSSSAARPQKPSGSSVAARFHAATLGFSAPIWSSLTAAQLPELEPLDLAGRGLRQLVDEIDPAWVFVRRDPRLHELLQLLGQRVARLLALLEQHEGPRFGELVLVLRADDAALEHGQMLHERSFDLGRRDPLARD